MCADAVSSVDTHPVAQAPVSVAAEVEAKGEAKVPAEAEHTAQLEPTMAEGAATGSAPRRLDAALSPCEAHEETEVATTEASAEVAMVAETSEAASEAAVAEAEAEVAVMDASAEDARQHWR